VYLHRYSHLVTHLSRSKIDSLSAQDPRLGQTPIGGLISQAAGSRVKDLVQDALDQGANILAGKFDVKGAIVQPLVLESVKEDMDIFHQESFGPTVALFEFDTVDEAIRLANNTDYGLVSSVFSENIAEALIVARQIKSGSCHINGPTVHGVFLPP